MKDLQTGQCFDFLCNDWLDVSEGDGSVMKSVSVATPDDLNDFDFLFEKFLHQEFYDGHIWLSVFKRPIFSSFSTVQRLCTCFTLLTMTMLANVMFYRGSKFYGKSCR